MYCARCGTQLPDDAVFCVKCGTQTGQSSQSMSTLTTVESTNAGQVLGSANATSLKCPTCGASIAPKFGEMIITCEYCGASITLGSLGWSNIKKQTMLVLKVRTADDATQLVRSMMDRGSPPSTLARKLHSRRNEPLHCSVLACRRLGEDLDNSDGHG